MLTYVLGAPGTGKSTLAPLLRRELDGWVVLDWDALLDPAGALAGAAIRADPSRWARYDELVRAAVDEVVASGVRCVVLGPRTPDELAGWPVDAWLLLDCADPTLRERLARDGRDDVVEGALSDAARYRSLALPSVDAAGGPEGVAAELAATLGAAEARYREI